MASSPATWNNESALCSILCAFLFRASFCTGQPDFWASVSVLTGILLVYAAEVSVTFFYLSKYLLIFQAGLSLLILYASVICLLVQQYSPSEEMGCFNKALFHRLSISCAQQEKEMHI